MEPKFEIAALLPAAFSPETLRFAPGSNIEYVLASIAARGLRFPLIAKPDIGMKGMAVAMVADEKELEAYLHKAAFDFLVQELIAFPNELGIFYYRYPGAERGHISGMVHKEFLTVTGDGTSSLAALLSKDPRHLLQMAALQAQYGSRLQSIPRQGELLNLVPFGNHARGAKFTDAGHRITALLTESIDRLCRQVPGFYYGRLDIRYKDFEDLEKGLHFSIIELNGAGSDPTHMFDPKHSYFYAVKEICRHWKIMYHISRMNHRNGIPYLSFREGMAMLRAKNAHVKVLENFS